MKKLAVFLISITWFAACHSDVSTETLALNDGKKWQVNEEMTPHIEKGMGLLADYQAMEGEDFHKLAQDLTNQNTDLIRSCTMKGKPHDELHKWLHPHMNLIEQLSKAKDQNEASELIDKIEISFETYQKFFE